MGPLIFFLVYLSRGFPSPKKNGVREGKLGDLAGGTLHLRILSEGVCQQQLLKMAALG